MNRIKAQDFETQDKCGKSPFFKGGGEAGGFVTTNNHSLKK